LIAQLEFNIYRDFVAYVAGQLTLSEFRRRFDLGTWNQQIWNSSFIGQVELALAELSGGDRTEIEFKNSIKSCFPNVTLELPLTVPSQPLITGGTSSSLKLIPGQVAIAKTPDSPVGRLREVAPV
jgi:hypothetical protein